MTSWTEQLKEFGCGELFSGTAAQHLFTLREWRPNDRDKSAAWALYTEIRTRITTQPLAYGHGDEEAALTSVFNIFDLTRTTIKAHEGCTHFATLAVHVLNVHIRPFTAYWHKVKLAGRLSSSDTRHRFRRELARLQVHLRSFMQLLGHLAEGVDFNPGTASGIESAVVYPAYGLGGAVAYGIAGSDISVTNAADIDAAEQREIAARRKHYGLADTAEDAVGLAISGGGIRSATFALGVVGELARKGIVKSVDFVSTVSGGGYLGSFMSSYLNDPENGTASLKALAGNQPFGAPGEVESKAVRHLRNHSKYMAEGGFRGHAVALGQMLYGIAANLLLMLPFILLAVVLAHYTLGPAAFTSASTPYPAPSMSGTTWLVAWLLLGSAVALPIVQNIGRIAGAHRQGLRSFSFFYERWWCVGLLVVLVALLLWSALPQGYRVYRALIADGGAGDPWLTLEQRMGLLTAGATALPFLAGVFQRLAGNSKLVKGLLASLLVVSGPLFFLVVFFVMADHFFVRSNDTTAMWLVFAATALYGGFLVNINYTSLHRYYRRQLSRTYLRRATAAGSQETQHLDAQPLSSLVRADAEGGTKAPYHLINCALNIPACRDANLRGRNTDFFVFSKHYCGSPMVGYAATEEWEALDPHLDLATAMAISAAAAAPQMGTRPTSGISYLLALLNVRLNYWAAAPRKPGKPGARRRPVWLLRIATPGMWHFFKEVTGWFMDERGGYLNLTDGGHIENLGIYELLRRRCRFVIAIDGEADPEHTFHGLLTLVRLAKIDLGATIDADLAQLRKDDRGDSQAHFLLCEIDYGEGLKGLLLYIKSSMTGNESEFLQKYRAEHPSFPHESTADQLFDEAQFEAYRALGEHVAQDLFRSDLVDSIEPGGPALPAQPTVRQWFQALANSLLG